MAGEYFWYERLDLPNSIMCATTEPNEDIPSIYEKCSDIFQIEIEEVLESRKILCIVK